MTNIHHNTGLRGVLVILDDFLLSYSIEVIFYLGFELQSDLNLRLLGFVWEFGGEGRGGEGFRKEEGASGRNIRHWKDKALGVNFLFIIQNPPHLGN